MAKNLIGSLVALTWTSTMWAGTVVCSNLGNDDTALLCDSSGLPLPLGCYVTLGHFGSLTPSEIEQKVAAEGIPGAMAIWQEFGDAFALGTGAGLAGCFEVELRQAVGSQADGPLHTLILNGPSPEASTSLTLLSFPGTSAPGDPVDGLPETEFLHLRDASVVFGNRAEGDGIQARPAIATAFASWVHDQLGADEPLSLALDADADGDGVCNLAEYALLGDPTDAADDVRLDFIATEAGLKGRFPTLADDPLVTYRVEICGDLSDEDWLEYDGELEVHSESDLPAGYLECRVPLPDMDRHFLRIRVAYTGGAGE